MDGFTHFLLTRAWEEMVLFLLVWGSPLLLAVVCMLTLKILPPQRRRGLFALLFILLGLAAVLFGGAWVLNRIGLVWRIWFQESLSVCLWLVGLTAGILTVVYARRWLSELGRGMRAVITGLCALGLTSIMLLSGFGILMFVGVNSEQVGIYQGRKVVQEKMSWHRCSYYLYEYSGPLVRSRYSIGWSRLSVFDELTIDAG